MSAGAIVAAKDWREFARDRRLILMAGLALLLGLAALFVSVAQVRSHEANRAAAEAQEQRNWMGQGARNPHGAAHFSRWAMRPLKPGAWLDPGVTPYAGGAVWMEAHRRNSAQARAIDDEAAVIDLGRFSAAWVLQVLAPLLVFAIAAGLVARERERGTLRLMLASGTDPGAMLRGKAAGIARIGMLIAVPVLAAGTAAALLTGADAAALGRIGLWAGVHALFFLLLAAIAVAVASRAANAAGALMLLIGLWLAAFVLVPRAGAGLAEALAPTPSAESFAAAIAEERKQLPDIFRKDEAAFTAAILRRYGVDDPARLPVSLPGLQLDADERIVDRLTDRHHARLEAIYRQQRDLLRWTGLVSPLVPLQNISMALAGTDGAHQLAFQRQAEQHRRHIVGLLNRDLIVNGVAGGFDYTAGPALWAQIPDFRYAPPDFMTVLRTITLDLALLLGWLVLAAWLLARAGRALGREER